MIRDRWQRTASIPEHENCQTSALALLEGVKKSRLCRLMCGKAQPFRTPGPTLKQLGWAACRKATGFPHIKRRSRRGVSPYAEEKPSDWG
jgi:hypothetical protein